MDDENFSKIECKSKQIGQTHISMHVTFYKLINVDIYFYCYFAGFYNVNSFVESYSDFRSLESPYKHAWMRLEQGGEKSHELNSLLKCYMTQLGIRNFLYLRHTCDRLAIQTRWSIISILPGQPAFFNTAPLPLLLHVTHGQQSKSHSQIKGTTTKVYRPESASPFLHELCAALPYDVTSSQTPDSGDMC